METGKLRNAVLGVCSGLLWLVSPTAHAQFLGQTVTIAHVYPNKSSLFTFLGLPANFVVGPGIELTYASAITMDLSDSRISLTFPTGGNVSPGDGSPTSFSGYRFSDALGLIPDIVGLSLDPGTNVTGFGSGNLSFDVNNVFLNFDGVPTIASGRAVIVDVQFAPVPEIGTLPLILAGSLGTWLFVRRRQDKLQ